MNKYYPLKLLSLALLAGALFGTSGCLAGRNHELTKTTTTYASSGEVESVEEMSFESGITFVNAKADLSEIEFNESLGKEGEVWQSAGSADSAKSSPEDRVFRTIENSFALWRGMPIPDLGSQSVDARLSRIEKMLSNQANQRTDTGPTPVSPSRSLASIPDPNGGAPSMITLTPEQVAQLRYLDGLRDSPNQPTEPDIGESQ